MIATYLLAVLGGNTNPTAEDLKAILSSVGVEADNSKIELLLSQVRGRDLTKLIAAGREMLASVPSGGGDGVVVASGGATAVVGEKKEEEMKVEEKEESDEEDFVLDIFG